LPPWSTSSKNKFVSAFCLVDAGLIKLEHAQVRQAQQRVKAERVRQQQTRLNQARAAVTAGL
jgi:hypothetical protein